MLKKFYKKTIPLLRMDSLYREIVMMFPEAVIALIRQKQLPTNFNYK
ncbi:MAG: hypothetical protein MRK01_11155 [Candidatus Scalindua sp.]|nr:hypothetical protein [Candidatus Scalindua sp.]